MSLWDLLTVLPVVSALVGAMATEHFMGGGLIRGLLGVLSGIVVGALSLLSMRAVGVSVKKALGSVKRPSEFALRLLYFVAVCWFLVVPFVTLAVTRGVVRLVLGPEEHFVKQQRSSD
jgi:ABC-type lipoprotein release transport system permease subunit